MPDDKLGANDSLIDELREALLDVTASLVAAHSLLKNVRQKSCRFRQNILYDA